MSAQSPIDWQMTSAAMGQRVLPAMQRLPELIPNLDAAVLCTADGYNLLAMGFSERQVGKMAALASSMFSIGTAIVGELPNGADDDELDSVTLASADTKIVGVKIPHTGVKHLVLVVAARKATLGIILVGATTIADEIRELFR